MSVLKPIHANAYLAFLLLINLLLGLVWKGAENKNNWQCIAIHIIHCYLERVSKTMERKE